MISQGRGPFTFFNLVALALLGATIGGPAANAQATLGETAQTLDRVDIIYATDADNIEIDTTLTPRSWVSSDYALAATSSFTQCQNTATRGIYCLDGNTVKRFPSPSDSPVQSIALFDCSNSAFRFNQRAACDTLTVDITGTMWLAAAKGQRFSLFKVVQANTAPDSSWIRFTTTAGTFFTREYATGRPQLRDLAVIDGDVAAAFPLSTGVGGVIAVEQKAEVTFFPDAPGATPVLLGDATTWGLARDSRGKLTEEVQSATLLQKYVPATLGVTPPDDVTRNWLLITTSNGRLVSREIPWSGPLPAAFNHGQILAASTAVATACGQAAFYDIQASVKSRSLYVSDRRGCRALALTTNVDSDGFTKSTPLSVDTTIVIASTSPMTGQASLQEPPQGVSIAPGSALSMAAECVPGKVCPLVGDGADTDDTDIPAASMTNVRLDDGSPDGLFVFQIKNIADCRYFNANSLTSPPPAACRGADVMFKADGTAVTYDALTGGVPEPHKLFLNVRPLLPLEITRVKTTLPARMLLSPRYKALTPRGRKTFDALFGIAEPGVRFRETFDANFDLEDLLGPGIKLGCGGEDLPERLIDTTAGPQLDIVVTISEDYTTVGGVTNGGRQHTDMLVNSDGCDPRDPPLAGTRWSMFAYGLMMTPDLDDPTAPTGVRYSDSILAKLTLSLFKDLGETIDTYACLNNDGGTGVPLSATDCTNLKAGWVNTNDKLTKCVESSTQPLNSTEIRTCNAFEVQYAPFATLVNGLLKSPTASDPANRVGELKARLEVFRYVYDSQFKPSIPADTGFSDPL